MKRDRKRSDSSGHNKLGQSVTVPLYNPDGMTIVGELYMGGN